MKRIILLITLLCYSITNFALSIHNGDKVTISQPVYQDIYVVGGTLTVNAPIYGDLIALAGTVIINDTVNSDIIIGGGKVTINSLVGDDVRGIGGEITLNGYIQGDLAISGGTIITTERSMIYGDAIIAGGTMTLAGIIKGSLKCMGGDIHLNAVIEQAVDCRGETVAVNGTVKGNTILVANRITIGDSATFHKDVQYWNKAHKLDCKQSLIKGAPLFEPDLGIVNSKWYYLQFKSAWILMWYAAIAFTLIAVIQHIFGKSIRRLADTASTRKFKHIGYGFFYLLTIPILAITLIITIIGLPIGLILIVLYGIALVLSTYVASIIIANWINNRRYKKWGTWGMCVAAFVTFIIIKSLSSIPVIGWLIMLAAGCLSFGTILGSFSKMTAKRNTKH